MTSRVNRHIRTGLILLLFAAPAVVAIFAARAPAYQVGQPTPDFSANLLDGTPVQLSEYTGQVVVLNFWATWCAPCREEMPLLQALHERGDAVVFTVNNGEAPAQIHPFLAKHDLSLPVVLDEQQQLQRGFGVAGYPTTLFISPDGVITSAHRGLLTERALTRELARAAK